MAYSLGNCYQGGPLDYIDSMVARKGMKGMKGCLWGLFLYHLLTHKSSLNTHHVPGTVLGTGKKLMSRSDIVPALRELNI